MRRCLRLGLFIGLIVGLSACAAQGPDRGVYGSVEVGRGR